MALAHELAKRLVEEIPTIGDLLLETYAKGLPKELYDGLNNLNGTADLAIKLFVPLVKKLDGRDPQTVAFFSFLGEAANEALPAGKEDKKQAGKILFAILAEFKKSDGNFLEAASYSRTRIFEFPPIARFRDAVVAQLDDSLKKDFSRNFHAAIERMLILEKEKWPEVTAIFRSLEDQNEEESLRAWLARMIELGELPLFTKPKTRREDWVTEQPRIRDVYLENYGAQLDSKHLNQRNYSEVPKSSGLLSALLSQWLKKEKTEHHDPWLGLFVVAPFGVGKSMSFRYLAAEFARSYLDNWDGYVPVYLELSEFSQDSHRFIEKKLQNAGLYTERMQGKRLLFFLDALDESGAVNVEHFKKVFEDLDEFFRLSRTKWPDTRYVVIPCLGK